MFILKFQFFIYASVSIGPPNLPETTEPTKIGEYANEDTPSQTGNRQNHSSSILLREMLFVRYSKREEDAFLHFQRLASDNRKLPREWKRLLNYHRLVWYIFSVSTEAKILAGWQVQLITWIFVCWEWQENMNLVVEKWKEIKWKEISNLDTSESKEPSLLIIVEHLIEQHERESQKTTRIGKEESERKRKDILGEAKINNEEENLNETTDDTKNVEKDTSQRLVKEIDKLDTLEKSMAELKKEMKKLKEPVSDDMKEQMKELIKQVSDDLKEEMIELKKQMSNLSHEFKEEMKGMKKEINGMREQMLETQNGKKQQNMENEKIRLHNLASWKRMKSTLERYNVSMDGIQAFQRFRFYCIAGFLPRPSSREQ